MAKADNTASTPGWVWLREAVERAGSLEALLPHLCAGRILSRHGGLYSLDGDARSGPGNISPNWWTDARVDGVTGRAIFTFCLGIEGAYGEEFADDVELKAAAVERLFPTAAVPEEPSAAAEPTQAAVMAGKDWLIKAVERHAQVNDVPAKISQFSGRLLAEMKEALRRGEVASTYADTKSLEARLHELKLWPLS
jgi:hypothetical protein